MRLINADRMVGDGDLAFDKNLDFCDGADLENWVDSQPTVDAELVTHAHWVPIKVPGIGIVFKCTACEVVSSGGNYCSHCGAKMGKMIKG